MDTLLRARARRAAWVPASIVALCGIVAAYASVRLEGTKTGLVLALGTTIGPALLYAAIVSPLAFPFSLYVFLVPYDNILNVSSFGTVTRILGIATGMALLFYMLRTKRAIEPPRSIAFWILLLLWMTASMFWAIDVQTARDLLVISLQLFLLYTVVSLMPVSLQQLRLVVGVVMLGGVSCAAYGLYAYQSGVATFKDRLVLQTDTSMLNPDHFAASLLLPLLLCLAAIMWTRSLFIRVGAAAGALVILRTITLTGSRAAEMGFAAALLYLIWRDRHRIWIACAGVVLAAAATIAAGSQFSSRWAIALTSGGAGRTEIWKTGWLAFKENWLFGAGFGGFPFAYDHAFISTFQPVDVHWHRASHNIILGYGVELGVVGLILLLCAWWAQFRLLSGVTESDGRFPLKLALEATLVGLFVCGMFADLMIEKYVWLAFMLVTLTYNAGVRAPQPPALYREVQAQQSSK